MELISSLQSSSVRSSVAFVEGSNVMFTPASGYSHNSLPESNYYYMKKNLSVYLLYHATEHSLKRVGVLLAEIYEGFELNTCK